MGIRDDARRNQMHEQSAEVARRQAAATSRPGVPTLFELAAASVRQKAIDTLPEFVANEAKAARRQQPQRVMRMLATNVNDAEERELRRLEAGDSSERENSRSRRRTVGHQPMMDPMGLLLSNQERQQRINELLGFGRVPLIRRVDRVRTGLAPNRNRRIGQKFKNNTGKIFTFIQNARNRRVVVLRDSNGKNAEVDKKTFKRKYVATGNLAQKIKSEREAKRQQRLKNQIFKKGGKTDVFRVQPRTMIDTDRNGVEFERVLGNELMLTNDAIKKLIKHAKVNPNAVRAGRVAETLNKNALESMLQKGIRIDADAAPAGGRMLGIGRATGNQAEMFMQPMSVVAEFVGGRRKPNARYFYSPRRRISESTPSRNNTTHTRKAKQKATQKIAQKPKQKATRKAIKHMNARHGAAMQRKGREMERYLFGNVSNDSLPYRNFLKDVKAVKTVTQNPITQPIDPYGNDFDFPNQWSMTSKEKRKDALEQWEMQKSAKEKRPQRRIMRGGPARDSKSTSAVDFSTPVRKQSVLQPNTLNLDAAFEKAEKLGEGQYGQTRLVRDERLVMKKFKVPQSKKYEENLHLKVWNLMTSRCQQYICEPIKTDHDLITLQVYPSKDGNIVETLKSFRKKKQLKLSKTLAMMIGERDTKTKTINPIDSPNELIRRELIKAFKCIHSIGVAHLDIKPDNLIVVYNQSNDVISKLTVKLIDFGVAAMKNKPLVTLKNDGTLDTTLLEIATRKANMFANAYLFKKSNTLPNFGRPQQMKDNFLPKIMRGDITERYKREIEKDKQNAKMKIKLAIRKRKKADA